MIMRPGAGESHEAAEVALAVLRVRVGAEARRTSSSTRASGRAGRGCSLPVPMLAMGFKFEHWHEREHSLPVA